MQYSKNVMKLIFGIIILLFGVSSIGCSSSRKYNIVKTDTVNTSETNYNSIEPIEADKSIADGIEISINYGFNHYAKFGRYMNIRGEITALESDFQGIFQIILPEQSGNNVAYEEKVTIVKGEKQSIVMDVLLNGSYSQFQYQLLGTNKESVLTKTAAIEYSLNTKMTYIGVLSNSKKGFSYLQGADTKAFYLDENIINDNYLSLDALDVIVVSDYNLNKLTKDQYSGIKEWIKSGGTIVLSANPAEMSNQNTPYKSMERALYKITLGDSKAVKIALEELEEKNLLQFVSLGLGRIQVFGLDLRLEEKEQETTGQKIVSNIIENLPMTKKQQLNNEIGSPLYDYRMLSNILLTSSENLPRVAKYVVVLLVYIILVGPVIYIVLKKKEKRNLTWVVVPITSAIFTVIVFFMGNSTRVKEPYIGYNTITEMEQDGKAESNTIFSVTSPYNKPYELSFQNKFGVCAMVDRFSYGGNYYNDKISYDNYNISISKEQENTKVKIRNHSAFTPAYFTSKSKISVNGDYNYHINDTNNTITGTFTNNLGYPLYDTVLLCDGILIRTGDLSDGETIQLNDLEKEDIPTPEALYNSELIDKIAGGKKNSSNTDEVRKHNVLESCIVTGVKEGEKSSFLIGFAEKPLSTGIFEQLNYKTYGVEAVKIPLEINHEKDGFVYINDLSNDMEVMEGYYDPAYRYISSEELIVTYSFKPEDKIITISYGKRGNLEFYNNKQSGFMGNAYFYNNNTREYDKIFRGGEAKDVTELSQYLNSNNELLMKVKIEKDAESKYAVTLPMLTAVKEGNQ